MYCVLQSLIFDMINTPYEVIDLTNKIQAKYENRLGKEIPWYSSAVLRSSFVNKLILSRLPTYEVDITHGLNFSYLCTTAMKSQRLKTVRLK